VKRERSTRSERITAPMGQARYAEGERDARERGTAPTARACLAEGERGWAHARAS
jgi:hypothetical protein